MLQHDRAKSHREDAALEARPELLDLRGRSSRPREDQDETSWQDDAAADPRQMQLWQRVDGRPAAPGAAAPTHHRETSLTPSAHDGQKLAGPQAVTGQGAGPQVAAPHEGVELATGPVAAPQEATVTAHHEISELAPTSRRDTAHHEAAAMELAMAPTAIAPVTAQPATPELAPAPTAIAPVAAQPAPPELATAPTAIVPVAAQPATPELATAPTALVPVAAQPATPELATAPTAIAPVAAQPATLELATAPKATVPVAAQPAIPELATAPTAIAPVAAQSATLELATGPVLGPRLIATTRADVAAAPDARADVSDADKPAATAPSRLPGPASDASDEVLDGKAAVDPTTPDALALQRAPVPEDGASVTPQRAEGAQLVDLAHAEPAHQPEDRTGPADHHHHRHPGALDPHKAHAPHGADAAAGDVAAPGHDAHGAHGKPGGPPAAAAQDGALDANVDELREADPRGAARPEIATQTTAIDKLGHVDLTPHAPHEQPAAHDDHKIELPAHAKTLDEVNAAVHHQHAAIVASGKARETHTAARIHATAPHRSQAEHQRKLAQQQGHRSVETQKHSQQQAHQHKLLSKQELRAKLTATATQKKQELTKKTATKTTELETQLKAKLAKLVQDQQQQNDKITKQLDAKAKALEADIGHRKAAHDKQIVSERAGLEKLDATEVANAKAKAKSDADGITSEAQTQAGKTLANANQRAGEVEAKGNTEAQAARAAGETKATQAIAAANTRAGQLDADHKDEAQAVRAEGQHRAQMARDAAKSRADGIHSKATADATALRSTGKADHDKQIADGATRAAQAIQNGEDAAAKIHAQTQASIAAMQAKSDAAVTAMQTEVTNMRSDIEAQRAAMNAKAQTALADAQAKAETEQQKALADMAKERDTTLKSIDDKVTADLAKIDASNDKDLARLNQQVEHDISAIHTSVQRAEQHIEQSVQRAEQHVETQVAKARAEIHTETAHLLGHLDHLATQARQRIAQHDRHVKEQIHAEGQHGRDEVARVAHQAQSDLAAADGKLLDQTKQQGEQNRAVADKLASDSQLAMETSRKDLDKDINKAWVDDAVKKAHAKLDDSGWFNVVTDGEANEAMNLLNSLPPDQQGEAIKQLDQKSFDHLLDQVPSDRREEFKSLVDNTHDPERKLELWGEQHKSEVANDARKEHEKTKDDGSWLFGRNAEQERNHRLNERRDDIVKSTDHEVDDEMKFLLDKQAKGTLTEQDVLDLEARKEHEHRIEMKYNVNLTNKDGTRKDGTKIAWSEGELNQVESALAHMPEGHVKDNTLLKEIKRSDQSADEKDPNHPRIGGQHGDGVISIYDLGATGNYRHTGDTHELADPSLRGVDGQPLSKTGDRIGSIEETLNHEFGHDIHDQNPDAFKRYQQAAGWQEDVGDKQMANAGISAADIAAIKAGTKTDVKGSDGKVYKTDPYNDHQVLAVNDGAIPEPGTGATPNSATGGDTWDYARTNYKDNFAEQYTKAINVPEKLAKDLIDAPAARVNNERTNRDAAQTGRDTAQADLAAAKSKTPIDRREIDDRQAQLDAANKRLEDANKRLDDANKDQVAQKTEYDIMRNDIFHADQATNAAAKRLADKGVDPAKIAEFRAKAARAQTPQQVDLIASGY